MRPADRQRLLQVVQRRGVVPLGLINRRDIVERRPFPRPVADRPADGQRLFQVVQRRVVVALGLINLRDVVERRPSPARSPIRPTDRQRLFQVPQRRVVVALGVIDLRDVVERRAFARPVADLPDGSPATVPDTAAPCRSRPGPGKSARYC